MNPSVPSNTNADKTAMRRKNVKYDRKKKSCNPTLLLIEGAEMKNHSAKAKHKLMNPMLIVP